MSRLAPLGHGPGQGSGPRWTGRPRHRRHAVKFLLARSSALLAALALSACVVYEPVVVGGGTPATYERAWNAAVGSYHDQGVSITAQDRTNGVIEGRKGDITVRSRVVTQADGKVRVEMNTGGT